VRKLINLKAGVAPIALGIAMIATPAFAQDAAEDAADEAGDVIIVTGTRIQSPNMTASAPVTTVSSEDIKISGTTRTEDLLNSLPQVVAGQNAGYGNAATGTAEVDLRGLGSQRTMVLVNGRRLMTGDPNATTSAADLNFIPAALVKRIDVLTGGASATYGADAVAGVVNFVMDTEFEGFRIDANYGFYQHNNNNKLLTPLLDARQNAGFAGFSYPKGSVADGGNFDATISFGTGFDDGRGHATAYFGYRKVKPVLQARRDYSACTLQVNDPGSLPQFGINGDSDGDGQDFDRGRPQQCGGSLTNEIGTVIYYDTTTTINGPGAITSTVGGLGAGTLTRGLVQRYNFAPLNHFQRPDERYTAGVFADYEISEALHPYMEFMFMDDKTVAQIAPSGNFGNTLTINCDNPLMSAAQVAEVCTPQNTVFGYLGTYPVVPSVYNNLTPTAQAAVVETGNTNTAYFQLLRRNVEGGPRQDNLQHTAFRTVLGSRGDLGKAWSYDAYYQYGRTNYNEIYRNEFSVRRLTNALNVVAGPGGVPTCSSVLNGTDPNCVPFNVFGGTAAITPEALNYLNASGFLNGFTSQQVLAVAFTGQLGEYGLKSPLASDGVTVALGGEHRKDSLELNADNAYTTGDLTGQGAPTLSTKGSYKVQELWGEVEVPLIQDGVIHNLSFNGAYRYSHYEISNGRTFNTDTYKLSVDLAPVQDIRLRASYNRAVRVPNIQELFAPQFVGLDGTTDPCTGAPITAAQTGCIAQGLSVGQSVIANPAAQYNGLLGGNPNLNPEKATTKTLGVIIQPRMIPGFSLTVDWFDIKVKNAIQQYGADAILNSCGAGNATACALVVRNPAGSLWLTSGGYVIDTPQNVGGVQTRGIEFVGNYGREIGNLGRISLNVIGTMLDKYEVDDGLNALYDCAGYYGATCGSPLPKWRHRARLGFDMKNGIGVNLTWRHLAKVKADATNPSTALAGNAYNQDAKIGSQNYFDLAMNADIGDHLQFRIGVNNILDREPPLVTSGSPALGFSPCPTGPCNGNTWPGTYDALGRYIFTGVTLNF
jgi:iron complex outermembrane recepter protein